MDGRVSGLDLTAALARAPAGIDLAVLAELLIAGEAGAIAAATARAQRDA